MPKFKKGDKVRFMDTHEAHVLHDTMPEYFPKPGTIGVVDADSGSSTTQVRWADGSVRGPEYVWCAANSLLELQGNAAHDYYIRIEATGEDGATVDVNGPQEWVHSALAHAIMGLRPAEPYTVLADVLTRALTEREADSDGTD